MTCFMDWLTNTPDHQLSCHIMRQEAKENVNTTTSDPCEGVKGYKEVEERLEITCKKLCETEVNIRLFDRMIKNGVATNDVRSFVAKQAKLKSSDHKMNSDLTKKAMKSKRADACSLAQKLRRKKEGLINKLKKEYNFPNKKYRKLMSKILGGSANHRLKHIKKTKKKYAQYEDQVRFETSKAEHTVSAI